MTDRAIASRPSLEQVVVIVDFMEKHPVLALGQMRGMEGREESKRLWAEVTKQINSTNGPTRPMKSWIKYWADKKSTVRSKVIAAGGDPNSLSSNMEKRIWDLFLANDPVPHKPRSPVKQECPYLEEAFFDNDDDEADMVADEPDSDAFEDPPPDPDDRQMAIMDKLVRVMGAQASAMSQMASAAAANSHAMERLAESAQLQARALERLAGSLEVIGAASHDVRTAIVDIDSTMKRFYSAAPS